MSGITKRLRRSSSAQLEEEVMRVIRERLHEYRGLEDLIRDGHGTLTVSLTMRDWEWLYPKVGVETTSPTGRVA